MCDYNILSSTFGMKNGRQERILVREAQALGAGALVKKPYTLEGLVLAVRMELDTVKVAL